MSTKPVTERTTISTDLAPAAIGTYSQAVRIDRTVYISGQIPLEPKTMTLVSGGFAEQAERVFENLRGVCQAAGGDLSHCVKLTLYLTDLGNFQTVNETMARYFSEPFPARAAVEVAALPKDAQFEADAVMVLPD